MPAPLATTDSLTARQAAEERDPPSGIINEPDDRRQAADYCWRPLSLAGLPPPMPNDQVREDQTAESTLPSAESFMSFVSTLSPAGAECRDRRPAAVIAI
jgi:hypothetical protein